jgi:hypothetical protein
LLEAALTELWHDCWASNLARAFQVLWQDRFIASCSSWGDFWQGAQKLPTKDEKGAVFERLTQLYLQTSPEYQTELRDVGTLREVPPAVRRRLDLPSRDEGIDLIACTCHGQYWAIQSKFRSRRDKPLTRRELGTFTSLAFNTCSNIALAVVAHTASKPVSKRHLCAIPPRLASIAGNPWIRRLGV